MEIAYVTVGSNDFARSVPFYTALFEGTGVTKLFDHPRGGAIFGRDGRFSFVVLAPADGGAASVGNGAMVALRFDTTGEVDAFHARALELGGSDEGAPGQRGPGFYMAYFRDPEGNKIAACKLG